MASKSCIQIVDLDFQPAAGPSERVQPTDSTSQQRRVQRVNTFITFFIVLLADQITVIGNEMDDV